MTNRELIKLVPTLRMLAPPQQMLIAKQASVLELKPNAPYIAGFLKPPPVAFLVQGVATLSYHAAHCPAILPAFPPEWINLHLAFCLISEPVPEPSVGVMAAHSHCTIVHIPSPVLLEVARLNPDFAMRLAQAHARQSARNQDLLSTALHEAVPERLLYLLRLLALRMYHSPSFTFPYDQATGARMLACSREALSRAFATLRKAKKIGGHRQHVELL